MEEVEVNQIINDRRINYTRSQILDYRAKVLKKEINERCKHLFTIDKLIDYSHKGLDFNSKDTLEILDENCSDNLQHIYCSSLGFNNGIIDPKLQPELYDSILKCINEGFVSSNIKVVKINDHSHPVRFATPINQTCYSLLWCENDLSEFHNIPIVLGEYTGDVKYVGDEDICDESYSFQLTFKTSAFKYSGSVTSCNSPHILDEFSNNNVIQYNNRNTYYPENCEYVETNENSDFLTNKVSFYSKIYKKKLAELQSTDGNVKKIGARLLLPNDNEYVVSADKTCNEMAFLNHYECVLNNNYNLRINVQWHSVYIDGWPHIILTTIPGIGIKSGDELAADFGENWFSRIKRISEINIKNELIFFRTKHENIINQKKLGGILGNETTNFELNLEKNLTKPLLPVNSSIETLVDKYEVCEICQSLITLEISKHRASSEKNSIESKYMSLKKSHLLCSGCNKAFHWYCVNRAELLELESSSISWFCFQCVSLTLRILPSLISRIPFLTQKNIDLVKDLYNNYEELIPGVVNVTGEVILRSTDEIYSQNENEKLVFFRPSEYSDDNQRFFNEYAGLEGLSRLKPCYLCYSSFSSSNPPSVGISTICRIHRLHMAPDFDEFFNSVQYNNVGFNQFSKNNCLYLSLITENQGNKRKYVDSFPKDSDQILKSHIKKLSGSKYIIDRTRKIICSLRSSLYQSEKHRVELLCKIEKLRCIQDDYFRTISEGDGIIPIFFIRLGDTVINKEFSGKLYQGMVTKYYPKERLFHIEYIDGDREDLEYDDFLSLLINDIQKKRIKIEDLSIRMENDFKSQIETERLNKICLKTGKKKFFTSEIKNHEFKEIISSGKSKKDNLVRLIDYEEIIKNSVSEKVQLIHNIIIQKCNKENKGHILIRKIPEYRYVNQPSWNVLYGSLFINENLIKYNIDIVLSSFNFSTTILSIHSKLFLEKISMEKSVPITITNKSNINSVAFKPDENFETNTELYETIESSITEVLYWTQCRLNEISPIENDFLNFQKPQFLNKINQTDNLDEEKDLKPVFFKENNDTAIEHHFVKDSWIQKTNMIAQILQPYPNGIKWIKETQSWEVIYFNEMGQKIFKLFTTKPFDENTTVESLYLKACKFVVVSQTNNKIIRTLINNRKPKNDEIGSSIHKFVFNEWQNTIEDFLARYNLNNPDRCVYSISELNAEINSLRPFPENLNWCDSSYSFIVSLSKQERKIFRLDKFDFNIINCYTSAFNFATNGSNNSDKEFCRKKIRKFHSRIKNSDEASFKENLDCSFEKKIYGSSKKIKRAKLSNESKKCGNCTLTQINDEKKSIKVNICEDQPDLNSIFETEVGTVSETISNKTISMSFNSNIERNKSTSNSTENRVFNEPLEMNHSKNFMTRKVINKVDKPIIRASPTPSDPLSRARIIEYSKKADELRPFPHGITWCYRSARFKVRYRRPNDGCWTATSFTPTKYSSVKEAFESAIQKLAAHIDDYKNSNEIPIIPKRISISQNED